MCLSIGYADTMSQGTKTNSLANIKHVTCVALIYFRTSVLFCSITKSTTMQHKILNSVLHFNNSYPDSTI